MRLSGLGCRVFLRQASTLWQIVKISRNRAPTQFDSDDIQLPETQVKACAPPGSGIQALGKTSGNGQSSAELRRYLT